MNGSDEDGSDWLQVTVFLSFFFSTFFFFFFVFIITNLLWLLISFTLACSRFFPFVPSTWCLLRKRICSISTIYVRVRISHVWPGREGNGEAVNMDYICDLLLLAFCWFKSLLIIANGTNENSHTHTHGRLCKRILFCEHSNTYFTNFTLFFAIV